MFGGKLHNQLVALAGALMLSSIAVGSAVLPGVVSAAPASSTEIVSYA